MEGVRRAGEAAPPWNHHLRNRRLFLIKRAQEDAVQAANIDHVVGQRTVTGRIEACGGDLLPKGEEPLTLPQTSPRARVLRGASGRRVGRWR